MHGQRLGTHTEAVPEVPSGVASSHVSSLDSAKVTGSGHAPMWGGGGGILSPQRQLQTAHMASVSQFTPLSTILCSGHRKSPLKKRQIIILVGVNISVEAEETKCSEEEEKAPFIVPRLPIDLFSPFFFLSRLSLSAGKYGGVPVL